MGTTHSGFCGISHDAIIAKVFQVGIEGQKYHGFWIFQVSLGEDVSDDRRDTKGIYWRQ